MLQHFSNKLQLKQNKSRKYKMFDHFQTQMLR